MMHILQTPVFVLGSDSFKAMTLIARNEHRYQTKQSFRETGVIIPSQRLKTTQSCQNCPSTYVVFMGTQ